MNNSNIENSPLLIVFERNVLLDKNLSDFDRKLYGLINALSNNKYGGCFATNSYLAKICLCSIRNIPYSLKTLRENKYISITYSKNNCRLIKSIATTLLEKKNEIADYVDLIDYDWLDDKN